MAKKQTYRKMGLGDVFNANLMLVCDVRNVRYDDVMEYMGMCRATFYDRKDHHPNKWTVENIESAAKLFKLSSGDMVSHMMTPEEVV